MYLNVYFQFLNNFILIFTLFYPQIFLKNTNNVTRNVSYISMKTKITQTANNKVEITAEQQQVRNAEALSISPITTRSKVKFRGESQPHMDDKSSRTTTASDCTYFLSLGRTPFHYLYSMILSFIFYFCYDFSTS